MEKGAKGFGGLRDIKDADEKNGTKNYETVWKSIRQDGAYVEAGENDNLIVQKIEANHNAVGIFGFSFLEENKSKIKSILVGGVEATYEGIASGKYPASRALFIYVKKQHIGVVPGIKEFLTEYVFYQGNRRRWLSGCQRLDRDAEGRDRKNREDRCRPHADGSARKIRRHSERQKQNTPSLRKGCFHFS